MPYKRILENAVRVGPLDEQAEGQRGSARRAGRRPASRSTSSPRATRPISRSQATEPLAPRARRRPASHLPASRPKASEPVDEQAEGHAASRATSWPKASEPLAPDEQAEGQRASRPPRRRPASHSGRSLKPIQHSSSEANEKFHFSIFCKANIPIWPLTVQCWRSYFKLFRFTNFICRYVI